MSPPAGNRPAAVAGILLTGGRSRRMGTDKASLRIGTRGATWAERLGACLAAVTHPAVEVGPGRSELPRVVEDPRDEGPLVALAAAVRFLWPGGRPRHALVLACDLPQLDVGSMSRLATWPTTRAVVPVVGGQRQPLCARWAPADLTAAVERAREGQRALGDLPGVEGAELLEDASPGAGASVFADIDTPADLARLELEDGGDVLTRPPPGRGDA